VSARGSEPDGATPEAAGSASALRELLDRLDPERAAPVFRHSSWAARRSQSYERLAFLGDSVLALSVTTHLFPRLDAERYGAGQLTKVRAQAVSGRSCRVVAERLGVPERLRTAAPPEAGAGVEALVSTERVLASVIEAVIGAIYLQFGYETTSAAVVEAFTPEIAEALEHPVDFKSALQERLAQDGQVVGYGVIGERGPPHDRTFTVRARIGDQEISRGAGRSKKDAEQEAARLALDAVQDSDPAP
jgi:ribonuclease-3